MRCIKSAAMPASVSSEHRAAGADQGVFHLVTMKGLYITTGGMSFGLYCIVSLKATANKHGPLSPQSNAIQIAVLAGPCCSRPVTPVPEAEDKDTR